MSAACQSSNSPTKTKNIQIRRVMLNDPSQMPSDLSTTPGGTLFSTTPGGTRLVYDRTFLLECRNSPLANSPPVGLPQIPGVTCMSLSPNQRQKNGVSPTARPVPHHHAPVQAAAPSAAPQVTPGHVADGTAPASTSPTKKTAPAGHGDEPLFEMDM